MTPMKFGMGQALTRIEDAPLLKGEGRFVADLVPPGALVGYVLRSPFAFADFVIRDVSAARAMKGVKAVFTAADLEGIGQTQVNTRIDMSFARGLRAILRQDPDVVMVGEIRDLETAQIAVQASLTGHLVLSTLHTNTAIGAVTRLRDMGVEPFLLASSLLGVLAQRLVRVLDPAQREAYAAGTADFAAFGLAPVSPPPTLYRPRAGSAGYRGRTGIHELVVVDEAMRALIHDNAAEADLERLARTRTPGILADGWAKCVAGVTSVEEVLRVTRDS